MKKILLVDDEESIHLLYREEFEEEGYEVHSALGGKDALEKFKIVAPDLVIPLERLEYQKHSNIQV